MARFRGTIKGGRGEASRLGTTKSGMVVEINGWDSGIRVYASVNEDGKDRFDIYKTGGSNGGTACKFLLKIKED